MDNFSRKPPPNKGRRRIDEHRSPSPLQREYYERRSRCGRNRFLENIRSVERGRRDELSQRRRARRSLSPFSDALVAAIGHSHRSRKRSRLRSRSLSRRRSTERRRSNSDESGRNRSRNREVLEPSYDERRRKEKTRRQRRRKHRERQRSSTRSPSSGSPPPQAQGAPNGTGTGVVSDDEEQGNIRSTGRAEHIPMDNFTRARGREASSSDEPTARPTSKSHNESLGHFQGGNGTVIADRYKIIREVGLGTFGRVIECSDLKHSDQSQRDCHRDKASVAIKIVRKIKRYYDSALIEADIVDAVNRRGGRGLTHCVVLHDAFSFAGHFCLVFESLGPSLYDFLKRHNYQSFPMACVQDFTVQLLEALEFLHSFRLVHTDLKIENILLMNDHEVMYGTQRVPASTRIKLIDFGGACYDSDKKSSVINTRQYRAPEVILGTGWSMPSDMWSVSCILAELYQGELLFATHDNIEHLALMERIIGPFPRRMVRAAKSNGSQADIAKVAFDIDGQHRMGRVLEPDHANFVRTSPRLEHLIRSPGDKWFLELLRKILVIDPNKRATAHECLQFLSRIRKNEVRYC